MQRIGLRQNRGPWFVFEQGDTSDPIYSHPLWTLHNTVPGVYVRCRYQYSAAGVCTFALATSASQTAAAMIARADRLRDGFASAYAAIGKRFEWAAFPADFGGLFAEQAADINAFPNVRPLLNHPTDRLSTNYRGPWAPTGIAWNRAWTIEFAEALAEGLDAADLPPPVCFHLTSENGPGDEVNGETPTIGWVATALADARATSSGHLVDGVHTFAQWYSGFTGRTGGAIPAVVSPVTLDTPVGRHPVNAANTERYQTAIYALWDYARFRAFVQPIHARFSGPVAEYGAAVGSRAFPVQYAPGLYTYGLDGHFQTDSQGPSWYGGADLRDESYTADDPRWNTLTNWLAVYPNESGQQEQRLGCDIAKGIATACAAAATHAPLCPWVGTFGGAKPGMMNEYLLHCHGLGADRFNVFFPDPTDATDSDYWQARVSALSAALGIAP